LRLSPGLAKRVGILVASVLLAVSSASGREVLRLKGTVRTPEEPAPRPVEVFRIDGVDYLDLNDMARVFLGTKYWRAELEKMVLKVNGHRIRLTVGSPFIFVDDEGRNLLAPVRWQDGRLVVPVRLATEILDPLITESVSWDSARLQLRLNTGDPNILGFDYDVRRNGTVIETRLRTPLNGEIQLPRPNRAVVRVPGGVLSPSTTGKFSGIGLLDSLVTTQQPGQAILRFYLGPLAGNAELLSRASPPRLLLAISEGLADDIPRADFRRGPGVSDARPGVQVVVIDPGHGGSDPGILSPIGVPEKEITLSIALRLKDLLEEAGIEARLTREEDRFLSAEVRAEFANGAKGDALVAIHCNGWFDSGMEGLSVGIPKGDDTEAEGELPRWGRRSSITTRRTELLGQILLEGMKEALGFRNRGLKGAHYAMLEGATMPAVLVECGFLTNHEEGTALSDSATHEAIAQALSLAIGDYRGVIARGGDGTP
jgi:N-acetylmuramoyl-L-alanine amidase